MKNQSMFPYRRNGPKKRGKGGGGGGGGPGAPGGRRHRDGGGGGPRRLPGSAGELLPLLQPATKALAQMLAGNTRSSGQLVHARNILSQANRLVDERHVDRLPPAAREDFFEQLARLKLTIADAEDAGLEDEARPETASRPVEPVGVERLREVALRLAMAEAPAQPVYAGPAMADDHVDEPLPERHRDEPARASLEAARERLRLQHREDATAAGAAEEGTNTGPRRERLRLKSLRPAAPDAEG